MKYFAGSFRERKQKVMLKLKVDQNKPAQFYIFF